jgi:hypothetical protein
MEVADADQLPREKGWTYEELALVVGSLYLDSHHRASIMEEQFNAVSEDYQKQILQLQAAVKSKQEEAERYLKEASQLRRELEKNVRTQPRPPVAPSGDGDNTVSDN